MKKFFLAGSIALALFSATACNTTTTEEQATTTTTEAAAPATQVTDSTATQTTQMAYICPMECEGSASMEPGKCPVCKMDLQKNPKYTAVVPAE